MLFKPIGFYRLDTKHEVIETLQIMMDENELVPI